MNLWPLLITFAIIASAELGDKTQLLTLGFSTRFPLWTVISAVSAASAVLMALAVIFGGVINQIIPQFYMQLAAGSLFIFFGILTIFGKEKDESISNKNNSNPFLFIFSAFFLAELGDKTQLATFALSAQYGTPFQVWVGATLGMILINGIAVFAGLWINKIIPEKTIKYAGAAIFILFGVFTLYSIFSNSFP
ncbi:MAG: TMEM165/GDT1 family protein [Candidatus Margulisiibacteriota bacterium]